MAATIIDTPGAADANSFCDVDYADAYWETRNSELWENVENKEAALINATRAIVNYFSGRRQYYPATTGIHARGAFFLVYPTWTGQVATSTQRLPWGRIGMFDRNGNAITTGAIPDDLKDIECELAGQMNVTDRMLDSNTAAKGIKRIQAGPTEIEYSEGQAIIRLLPAIIDIMMVPSWITESYEIPAMRAIFEVISD